MQTDIHPKYTQLSVTCSCGNSFDTHSTYSKDSLHVEACAKCHPAYTRIKNTGPAVGDQADRFNKRFKRGTKMQKSDEAA